MRLEGPAPSVEYGVAQLKKLADGRVEILEQLIKQHGGKCTMDYPENIFQGYDEALAKAAAASREYVQWLAQQGYPSR